MEVTEIEDELATRCGWCRGTASEDWGRSYWCRTCGGSGKKRTILPDLGHGRLFLYEKVRSICEPPYLSFSDKS